MRYDTTSNRTFLFIQVFSISIALTYLCTLIYAMAFVEKKNVFIRKKKNTEKEKRRKIRCYEGILEFKWDMNLKWMLMRWNLKQRRKKKFNGICGLKLIGFTYRLSICILTYHFILCIVL